MLILRSDNLSGTPTIAHGFFGRTGGVSAGIFASLNCGPGSGDGRASVTENRQRALAGLSDNTNAQLLTLYQIHSPQVMTVTRPWEVGQAPRADAMTTDIPGLALGILTADCVPVLLADAGAGVIGAAHAGWKGALTGVIASVVDAMEKLGARRTHIGAAIGPCISQQNYEVGPEFRANFEQADKANTRWFVPSGRPTHYLFDLRGYVENRLRAANVAGVVAIDRCTYADADDFFSYRRATHRGEKDYGRQLSAIMLR